MTDDLSLGDRKAIQTELERRKDDAAFIGGVNLIEKGKKERHVLAVGKNRLIILKSQGGKLFRDPHWLELVEIQSKTEDEVNLTFKSFKLQINSNQTNEIINCVRDAVELAFPGVPQNLKYKMDVSPSSRVKELASRDQPLGGFISTYKAMCDFYGVEVREDFCWDMENLFVSGNIKDFNLKEFEQPLGFNEVRSLVGALQYNTYFRSFTSKNLPLDKNMTSAIADCLKFNASLEEIVFSKSGINRDGITSISEALQFNKGLALTSITLSNNNLEDKGMQAFAQYIGNMNRGLVKLDLNTCGVGKLGMQALCNALKKNVHMGSTLTFFDISHNKLESEGSGALGAFLANPNSLQVLQIKNSAAQLEVVVGAILRGCNQLVKLDISDNKLTKKETGILAKYFQASANLNYLNLSATTVPVDAVKELITAITSNPYLKDFSLNLGDNKLGAAGARVIGSLVEKMTNIVSLDLSENDLGDEGIASLAESFAYNSVIKHLNIQGNFKTKTKNRQHAIEQIIKLISNDSDCHLESLNIAGSKGAELKNDLIPLIYELATNDKLFSIDISGNHLGYKGASALGKALQTNDKLLSLYWDNNLTPIQGFQAFNLGLKRNHTLINMPLPINDISAVLKGSEQQMTELVSRIENNLSRNQNPMHKFVTSGQDLSSKSGQSFGFLSSGQREEVQKLLYKIKSTGKKVEDSQFRIVLEDAEIQDQIMTSLFTIDDQIHQSFEHELKKELIGFVKNTSPLFTKMKGELIEQLMATVKTSFKCFPEDTIKRLQTNLAFGGKDLPEEEFERVLISTAAAELNAKANQAFHQTSTIASDYLYEKMYDLLEDIFDDLNNEGERKKDQKSGAKIPAAKTPTKPQPTTTPQQKAGTPAKVSKPPAAKKTTAPNVDDLPKVESNLEHANKDRPMQQGKRPPTRKKRPAPPTASTM